MLCLHLFYVCLYFQWETIDLTSSPVKRSQSSEVLPDSASASDMYSSITDSDSDEDGKTKSEDDCYFHNPKWPVWSRRSDGVLCEELIALILNDASKHPDKICKSRPVGVRHNALFVIDLNSVPLKNLTVDDNGSWDISTPRRMYKVEEIDNKGNISVKRANSAGPDVYTLYRQYGTHKATKKQKGVEFKRVVATVKDFKGSVLPVAILHYFFKSGQEEDLVLAPHGNSSSSSNFI